MFEHRTVAAPRRIRRTRRASVGENLAEKVQIIINSHAAEGWEYQGTQIVTQERGGWWKRGPQETSRAVMLFRRPVVADSKAPEPYSTHALMTMIAERDTPPAPNVPLISENLRADVGKSDVSLAATEPLVSSAARTEEATEATLERHLENGRSEFIGQPNEVGEPDKPTVSHANVAETSDEEDNVTVSKEAFLVWFPSGEVETFNDVERLEHAVKSGRVKRQFRVRPDDKDWLAQELDGTDTQLERMHGTSHGSLNWTTISELGDKQQSIRDVLRPKWASTITGLVYGVYIGVILKLLETAFTFFSLSIEIGIVFASVVAFIFIGPLIGRLRILMVGAFAILIIYRNGIVLDFSVLWQMVTGAFTSIFVSFIIGAAFGGPLGMIVGSVVGYFKARRIAQEIELDDEGSYPFLAGILLPLAWLVVSVPLYIYFIIELLPDLLA